MSTNNWYLFIRIRGHNHLFRTSWIKTFKEACGSLIFIISVRWQSHRIGRLVYSLQMHEVRINETLSSGINPCWSISIKLGCYVNTILLLNCRVQKKTMLAKLETMELFFQLVNMLKHSQSSFQICRQEKAFLGHFRIQKVVKVTFGNFVYWKLSLIHI